MATTRIMPLHIGKERPIGKAVREILDYVKNPEKTDQQRLISSFECDSRMADAEFHFALKEYERNTARRIGRENVIAYHLRQAFVPGEITPEEANRLGQELARRFTKGNHAYIVCTHVDKSHIHNHVVWCAVTLDCDRKFRNFWGSAKAVRKLNDTICIENGYSIVEDPQRHGKDYDKWLGDRKKPTHRDLLRMAIDEALAQNPKDMDILISLLCDARYEVKRGKVPAFRGEGQKKFLRMDTLGDGYGKEELAAVLDGRRKHVPRRARGAAAEEKISLLIDIQRKLNEGKGTGYQRWATVFNLKQMAQSLNYLREHGLEGYDELTRRTEEATAQFHAHSDRMKALEKRMDEITILRRHILNYVKTRDVYAAYRKAGYSKRFLGEHESDITLHKAAKKAFDELGLEKLPTVRSLQDEYSRLAEEKKKLFTEFRKSREEMKELLMAKANVDRVLGYDGRAADKQKEQTQR